MSTKKENTSPKKLIEPMDFDERCILEEPMIFYDLTPSDPNAKELIEPMEYFNIPTRESEPSEATELPPEEKTVEVNLLALCSPSAEATPAEEKVSEAHAAASAVGEGNALLPAAVPFRGVLPAGSPNGLSDAPQEFTEHQKQTALAEVQKILRYIHFISWREQMYCFDGQFYMPVTDKDISRILLNRFMEDFICTGPAYMQGVIYFLERYPSICRKEDSPEKNMVAFQNCVLNTDTGEILAHSPDYLLFYRIEAQYLPCGSLPPTDHFDHFLYTVSGGDPDLTERIWQFIGYCLTPDICAKAVFLLQGVSHSGKSVLSNLIRKLFSDGAVLSLQAHSLSGRFNKSELRGRALCVSADMPCKVLDNDSVSIIKQLSGDDELSGEVKHKRLAQFETQAKLIMATNHPLVFKNPDTAMLNRIVVIPFRYSIPRENWDTHLTEKILRERDGIVTKAIAAYARLRRNRYFFAGSYDLNDIPMEVSDLSLTDVPTLIQRFLLENCESCADSGVFSQDLYDLFSRRHPGIAFNTFMSHCDRQARQLFQAKKDRKRRPGGTNPISYIIGIRIRPEVNDR